MPLHACIVGGGMITARQILPSVYDLQRTGLVSHVSVCARHSGRLRELAGSEPIRFAFPGQEFEAFPPLDADPSRTFEDAYRRAIEKLPPRQLVIVATPETSHYEITKFALEHDQHVLAVKPFVLNHYDHADITKVADARRLWVGIEYHKRLDRRALEARGRCRDGQFGQFRCGEAKLIEPYSYRHSNFQNWFTKESTDPFTYVGCHYVDLCCFITGVKPTRVSVRGVEGNFPNGKPAYLWTAARVGFDNGAALSVINGLGYPDAAAGSNDQGMTLFFEGPGSSGMMHHADQYRGVQHCYLHDAQTPAAKSFQFVNPDFFRLVPWDGPGLKPVGYGFDSIEANVLAVHRANREGTNGAAQAEALIATAFNTVSNSLVTEAGRLSLLNDGREVRIRQGAEAGVALV
jgi:predicted dehydrogenase